MKKLVCTPLSNTIWYATVNEKNGTMSTKDRKDVTDNAIDAVFQHITNMNGFSERGFAGYEFPKKDDKEHKACFCVFDETKYALIPIGTVETSEDTAENTEE